MQTEIALSTTEAEYIALSTATRELIPLRLTILEVSQTLGIPCSKLTLKCTLFEDNKGAEELAKVPKYRPRTKHIAIKYHHFREWVKNKTITITRVSTEDQEGEIFTKPLPKDRFEFLRKKFMGWCCILTRNFEEHNHFELTRNFISGW